MLQPSQHVKPLFMVPRYWPAIGGAQLHTRELAKRISRRGPVGVVCHCSDETMTAEAAFTHAQSQTLNDDGIPVYQIGASGVLKKPLKAISNLYEQNRWLRPLYSVLFKKSAQAGLERIAKDYQLIHAVYNGLTPSAELAAAVCTKLDIPFIWTPLAHTTFPTGTGWSSPQFRRLYQRADALIAMTDFERDWLIRQGATADRVHICPVSTLLSGQPNPTAFRQAYGLGDNPVVLFLGRLVESKGYKQLRAAANIIWRDYPNTHFLFLGPLSDSVRDWFAADSDPRVIAPGLLGDADKTSALAACDLLCVPSTEESLGVTYLEAWTFAKPIVAADIPVLRTVIDHGVDGLLASPNSKAVAEALLQLLDDPQRRSEMGQQGAKKVSVRYDWMLLAERLASIHRSTVNGH